MTIETDIVDALKTVPDFALSGGRFSIYPDAFPQEPKSPVWPAVRYTIIGGTIDEDLCGAGDEETDDIRVQIDVVATDSSERSRIMRAVRTAMTLVSCAVLQAPPVNSRDEETKTFRAMADWMIYGSSS